MSTDKNNSGEAAQTTIPPFASQKIDYDPGFVTYCVAIKNQHNREIAAAISFDKTSGTLVVTIAETFV
jgi:multisubunit Na+/H+ antiporter MnhE subunit